MLSPTRSPSLDDLMLSSRSSGSLTPTISRLSFARLGSQQGTPVLVWWPDRGTGPLSYGGFSGFWYLQKAPSYVWRQYLCDDGGCGFALGISRFMILRLRQCWAGMFQSFTNTDAGAWLLKSTTPHIPFIPPLSLSFQFVPYGYLILSPHPRHGSLFFIPCVYTWSFFFLYPVSRLISFDRCMDKESKHGSVPFSFFSLS